MEKPQPKQRKACLDYHEAIKFIEGKYNIKTRDMAGMFTHNEKGELQVKGTEYLDFWHWLIDKHEEIRNDSYFTLLTYNDFEYYRCTKPIPDWVKGILDKIVAEFPPENDGIEFHVWW
jgi:hypothetical protein